jgi:hypothetical protein
MLRSRQQGCVNYFLGSEVHYRGILLPNSQTFQLLDDALVLEYSHYQQHDTVSATKDSQ